MHYYYNRPDDNGHGMGTADRYTNRLNHVTEDQTIDNESLNYGDYQGTQAGDYDYDGIGNLIADGSEDIETINWNVSGKITDVIRTTNSDKKDLHFVYSPSGERIAKG